MKDIYSRTRLCPYRNMGSNCNLSIDHGKYLFVSTLKLYHKLLVQLYFNISLLSFYLDISKIMTQSKDYDELLYYWHAWHEAIGPPLKNNFMRYVQLSNQASRLNGKMKQTKTKQKF